MTDTVRIHTSTRIAATDEPGIVWRATPEGRIAHAFRQSGSGWMRAVGTCRERLNFRMRAVAEGFPRCDACSRALAGIAPESESERRLAFGDR